ncbi:MAG: hypothetical protein ACE5F1_19420 [Planctomycetota bacterium]
MEVHELLELLPSVLAAALLALILGRPWQAKGVEGPAGLASPVVLGLAWLSGYAAILGWPAWPPVQASDWLPCLAVLGIAAGFLEATRGAWLVRVLLSALVPWLLFAKLLGRRSALEAVLWWVICYGSYLGFWWGAAVLAQRLPVRPLSLLWTLVASFMAPTLLLTGNAKLGQLAAVLAAALGAMASVLWIWPASHFLLRAVPVFTLLGVSLLAIGHTDLYGETPRLCTLPLLLALPSALLAGRRAWVALVLPTLILALALGIAIYRAELSDYGY